MFISVYLCHPHAYTQHYRESICTVPLAFLYFTSHLFTPRCPHTECGSTTTQSQVRSVFVTQQRCECPLKISMCAVMCVHVRLCVCAHLTLLSVVSVCKERSIITEANSIWNSMEYSMHVCLCYAQLSLLFWVLKIHNAKLELYLVFPCIVNAFFSRLLAWLHHTCNNLYVLEMIDGASAPEERNSDSCQHTSHVCPFEESDELEPWWRTGGLLLHLW